MAQPPKLNASHFDESGPHNGQFIPPGSPPGRAVLCSELPGSLLWPSPEDADGIAPEGGIELVHHLPGLFPAIPVQLAP